MFHLEDMGIKFWIQLWLHPMSLLAAKQGRGFVIEIWDSYLTVIKESLRMLCYVEMKLRSVASLLLFMLFCFWPCPCSRAASPNQRGDAQNALQRRIPAWGVGCSSGQGSSLATGGGEEKKLDRFQFSASAPNCRSRCFGLPLVRYRWARVASGS